MRCVNWIGGQACGSNSRGPANTVCHLGLIAFAVRINLLGRVSLAARAVDDVKLRCPAHAAFRTIRWPVTKVCCTRSSMVLRYYTGRFVCVARRQVMCRSGTCCAGYEESEGRCHIVEAGAASSSSSGLLAVACKADSARYIFWFLPQVAAGHLQALLGLVLLVHSRAGR